MFSVLDWSVNLPESYRESTELTVYKEIKLILIRVDFSCGHSQSSQFLKWLLRSRGSHLTQKYIKPLQYHNGINAAKSPSQVQPSAKLIRQHFIVELGNEPKATQEFLNANKLDVVKTRLKAAESVRER